VLLAGNTGKRLPPDMRSSSEKGVVGASHYWCSASWPQPEIPPAICDLGRARKIEHASTIFNYGGGDFLH
jgi:hypothetical protein